jgi:hypothetical protein
MKLVEIFNSTFTTPLNMKKKALHNVYPTVPDNYDSKNRLRAVLIKDVDNDIRYVKLSLIDNNLLLPDNLRKSDYDTLVGFFKVELDFPINDEGYVTEPKYKPLDSNVMFIFNLTKEVDRVRRKYLSELCDRAGIMHNLIDALEGYDDDDLNQLSDRDIRIQGLHEIIGIHRSSFLFTKTETI